MQVRASVQGDDQLVAALHAAVRELQQLDDLVGDDVGAQLATAVHDRAPVETGRLAKSVTHTGATVTVAAPYAAFVHARNPWAARAVDAEASRLLSTIEEGVGELIARIGD